MNTASSGLLGLILLTHVGFAEQLEVPARANPWLAGMTYGTPARRDDSAPEESPVQVTNTVITGLSAYTFSVSGAANHGAPLPLAGPDGEDLTSHFLGAENGLADLAAPFVSLVGVFLSTNSPDQTPAPPPLDFSKSNRNYQELAPQLQQPFFIGDGLTDSGAAQQVIAPIGSTRLFLGVMDAYHWKDNEGAFKVRVCKLDQMSMPDTEAGRCH